MSDAVKDGCLTERERFDLHVLVGVAYRSRECPDAVAAARATLVRLGLIHAFDIDNVRCGPSCAICREREPGAAPRETLLESIDVAPGKPWTVDLGPWRELFERVYQSRPRSYGCRCREEGAPWVDVEKGIRHWPSCPNHPLNVRRP